MGGGGQDFLQAIEKRRQQFKELGCVATDHGLPDAFTYEGSLQKMSTIFNTAYRRKGRGITSSDAKAFRGASRSAPAQPSSPSLFFFAFLQITDTVFFFCNEIGHMILEMARMSINDGYD